MTCGAGASSRSTGTEGAAGGTRRTRASGNGGNKIFVFDPQKLVIVITASAYGQSYMHTQVDDMMVNHLLPAVAAAMGSIRDNSGTGQK